MTLINQHLTRQLDLIPLEVLGTPITIIGAGAIGSFTTLALAKMGFGNIRVFDFDRVDIENMNSQFYRHQDVGKLKVEALADLIQDFTSSPTEEGISIDIVPGRYERGSFPGIVISAVDSMAIRKLIWEQHKGISPGTRMIIDPRMGAEFAALYVMNPMDPKDIESYERTLYTDESAVQERCTAKATVYTAAMLSGLVAKVVKDLATGANYPRITQWSIKEDQLLAYDREGKKK